MIRNAPKRHMQFANNEGPDQPVHIHAGWSGSSLSAYRMNWYCSICRRTENFQISLHGCAHFSGHLLFAYGKMAFFPCFALNSKRPPPLHHLSSWIIIGSFAIHKAPIKDSDQPAWMSRLMLDFAERTSKCTVSYAGTWISTEIGNCSFHKCSILDNIFYLYLKDFFAVSLSAFRLTYWTSFPEAILTSPHMMFSGEIRKVSVIFV